MIGGCKDKRERDKGVVAVLPVGIKAKIKYRFPAILWHHLSQSSSHPDWKDYIEAYYGRWQDMLGGPIQATVDVFRELKESGRYKLYALTNWSSETFPIALALYEFLHWFDGRVVSGDEKMRKPFPEFYQLILDRYQLVPEETLFIDDNVRNVKAAEALGIKAIAFTSAGQLKKDLEKSGVL